MSCPGPVGVMSLTAMHTPNEILKQLSRSQSGETGIPARSRAQVLNYVACLKINHPAVERPGETIAMVNPEGDRTRMLHVLHACQSHGSRQYQISRWRSTAGWSSDVCVGRPMIRNSKFYPLQALSCILWVRILSAKF